MRYALVAGPAAQVAAYLRDHWPPAARSSRPRDVGARVMPRPRRADRLVRLMTVVPG